MTMVSLPRSSVVSVSVPPGAGPKHDLLTLYVVERDLYPRRWGLGPQASEKKKLKASGKLDKYGRPNEATPAAWKSDYKDYNAPLEDQPAAAAAADVSMSEAPAAAEAPSAAPATPAGDDKKKRKKHDGETADEKAERKRLKAEKKAAKKARRASKGGEDNDSDSD